jgi:ketopantoate reductase
VKFTRNVCLYLGDETGALSRRAEELARVVDASGVRSKAVPDIRTREWSKFVGWIPLVLVAALTRQITWKFLVDPQTAVVVVRMARETAALATALQIEDRRRVSAAGPAHRARDRRSGHGDRPRNRKKRSSTSRRSTACRRSRTCCAAAGSNTSRPWATRSS